MNQQVFLIWALVLLTGISHVYSVFRSHFSGIERVKHEVVVLKEKLEREEMQQKLADYQFQDFRQSVAQLLPDKTKATYQTRNLASVVVAPEAKDFPLERAGSLMEKGKGFFRSGEFEEATDSFRALIRNYPNSFYAVESYFLLAEGQFQLNEFEDCLETIDTMMNLYPENELTGFVLLRMGDIFLRRDRLEDAEQVFRAIQNNFDNVELRRQATVRLKEVTL